MYFITDTYKATLLFDPDRTVYTDPLPPDAPCAGFGYYTDAETGLILCTFRYYDTNTGWGRTGQ